jgi:2-keto-4-pentenoate hydratase/2-oxohepta-3-ene-1,7-dioic acid hydratase in catechol pathway
VRITLTHSDLIYRLDGDTYILQRAGVYYALDGFPSGRQDIPAIVLDDGKSAVEDAVLPPIQPRCIFGLEENYAESARPLKDRIFTKPLNTLAADRSRLLLPPDASETFFEGELVAVIGQTIRGASPAEAGQAILGYTIGNDFSEAAWSEQDRQWWRAKGVDGFSPVGPAIHVGFPGEDVRLVTTVNGEVRQDAPLSGMRTRPPEAVAEISQYITLVQGDLVFLGTPSGAGRVEPGDVVEVAIGGLGTLRTDIASADVASTGIGSADERER